MLKAFTTILAVTAMTGCASTAPSDLLEEEGANLPFGRVTIVVKKTYAGASPGSAGMAGLAGMGAGPTLAAGALIEAVSRDTRYIHEIRTPSGELLTEMSAFEFPVGTCVSVGANKTRYKGILARSNRCGPA